jgi:hypothetical protein
VAVEVAVTALPAATVFQARAESRRVRNSPCSAPRSPSPEAAAAAAAAPSAAATCGQPLNQTSSIESARSWSWKRIREPSMWSASMWVTMASSK